MAIVSEFHCLVIEITGVRNMQGFVTKAVILGSMIFSVINSAPPTALPVKDTSITPINAQPVKTAIMEVHVSSAAQLIVSLVGAINPMASVLLDVMQGSLVANAMLFTVTKDFIRMAHSVSHVPITVPLAVVQPTVMPADRAIMESAVKIHAR